MIPPLPLNTDVIATARGLFAPAWVRWLAAVSQALSPAVRLPSYTVATVPTAANSPGGMIYVTDESGGAVPAFSDGTDWRRVTDRAVIS